MDLKRLSNNASAIIKMFKNVFDSPTGFDAQKALLFTSGLAGYACHQAVKANKEFFVVVEKVDHKKFYFGDDLNKYLLEDKYSVLSFCNGFFENFAEGETCPNAIEIVNKVVAAIARENSNYKIWDAYHPRQVYLNVKNCWNGIYDNMTAVYCQSPQEWPVLFAIVLQNIMIIASQNMQKSTIYCMALECAIYISKMDDDSI